MADDPFPPDDDALQARLAAVNPTAYARTRNHLDGAVTRLSPYLTHGFVTLREVAEAIAGRHALPVGHKLVYELGWRAWFRHAWRHAGDGILESLHAGPLPDDAYSPSLPDDLLEARTGVPVIDRAVQALYRVGWLHNHARMWLASYAVHVRKVHWRAGADWMIGHLLDGDLASNHLSWQWIAGTGSSRPYLFNAANVARYAPPDWHSPNTLLDADYPTLDRLARSPGDHVAVRSATVRAPTWSAGALPRPSSAEGRSVPPRLTAPPPGTVTLEPPDPALVMDRDVWLVHPWALRPPPPDLPADALRLGVFDATYHARWPWSGRRWAFATSRMTALAERLWFGDATTLQRALAGARSVTAWSDPHFDPSLAGCAVLRTPPALFREPPRVCSSFSQYWRHVSAGYGALAELLAATDPGARGSD